MLGRPGLFVLLCLGAALADEPASPETAAQEPALRLRLLSPFAGPRNGFFHSGLGIPLLRSAATPPAGTLSAGLRFSQTHSADTYHADGHRNRFDGVLIEHARLRLELPVHERITLLTDLRVAGWDERRDVFEIYGREGPSPVIQGEAEKLASGHATGRHENLSTVSLGAALTWWRGDDGLSAFASAVTVKLPGFRRADVTSSGTTDVALTALGSVGLGERVALHVNAGLVWPVGEAWIFEDTRLFQTHPLFQGAIGVVWAPVDWLALGASLQAETSPWDTRVAFLDRPSFTAVGGLRLLLGRFTLELGLGAGIGAGSPDWTAWAEVGYDSRPLWDSEWGSNPEWPAPR